MILGFLWIFSISKQNLLLFIKYLIADTDDETETWPNSLQLIE